MFAEHPLNAGDNEFNTPDSVGPVVTAKLSTEDVLRIRDMQLKNSEAVIYDVLLDDARHESSPLHKFFTWDNTVAAEKYRQVQARVLLKRVKLYQVPKEPKVPVMVKLVAPLTKTPHYVANPEGKGMVPLSFVAESKLKSLKVLRSRLIQARGTIKNTLDIEKQFPLTEIPMDDLLALIDQKISLIDVKLNSKQ